MVMIEWISPGQTVDETYYLRVPKTLREREARRKRNDRIQDSPPGHSVKQFLAENQIPVLDYLSLFAGKNQQKRTPYSFISGRSQDGNNGRGVSILLLYTLAKANEAFHTNGGDKC